MGKPTDIRCIECRLYFLRVETRVPLKFGHETLTSAPCARVRMQVEDQGGETATGWGETPLSVQWAWPSELPNEERHRAMKQLCETLAGAWESFGSSGHPIEVGHAFLADRLPGLVEELNRSRPADAAMPWLAGLICCSPFDIALHDAYGNLLSLPVYETYSSRFMNSDLAAFLDPVADSGVLFAGRFPSDYLVDSPPTELPAWHLVGG